jgi:hypothetical protein
MITVIIRTDLRIDENVPRCAQGAVGIIGFALPTMFTCVHADLGRNRTLHPYRKGHFLGSRQGHVVLAEAGLDGKSQYVAIREYTAARTQR